MVSGVMFTQFPWQHMTKVEGTGSLDEVIQIKATTAGMVEINVFMPNVADTSGSSILLRMQPPLVDDLIDKLAAARDAATLMASASKQEDAAADR